MADVNETLAGISAFIREAAQAQYEAWMNDPNDAPDGRYWSSFLAKLADRIDAAAVCKQSLPTETVTKWNGLGNAAAMREALERFADVPDEDLCELEKHAREMQDHCVYGGGALEGIILRVRIAKDALADPPRNCDRFCDLDHALSEYQKLPVGIEFANHVINRVWGDKLVSFSEWLFLTVEAPAAQEGGE